MSEATNNTLSPAIDRVLMPPPKKRLKHDMTSGITDTSSQQNKLTYVNDDEYVKEEPICQSNELYNLQDQLHSQQQLQIFQQIPQKNEVGEDKPRDLKQVEDSSSLNDFATDELNEYCGSEIQNETLEKEQLPQPKAQVVQNEHFSQVHTIHTRFEDIIGHGNAKLRLDEALLPLALPPALASTILTGVRAAPASILLHGPPGCGKTQLARAVAGEAQAAFLSVAPSDILSKFVGESEASVRSLFKEAQSRALSMESKCAVLFFDEIDALGQARGGCGDEGIGVSPRVGSDNSGRRILAELLIQMTKLSIDSKSKESEDSSFNQNECDALELRIENDCATECVNDHTREVSDKVNQPDQVKFPPSQKDMVEKREKNTKKNDLHHNIDSRFLRPRIIVVAATNRPGDCDPALLRRFSVRVFVGLPSTRDRKRIIRRFLREIDNSLTTTQLEHLSRKTIGYSGSDIESMTREAVMAPIRDCLRDAALLKAKLKRGKRKKVLATKKGKSDLNIGIESGNSLFLSYEEDDEDDKARELLLRKFSNLRPVSVDDFERAISFWMGDQEDDRNISEISKSLGDDLTRLHYDTSSSDEDEN